MNPHKFYAPQFRKIEQLTLSEYLQDVAANHPQGNCSITLIVETHPEGHTIPSLEDFCAELKDDLKHQASERMKEEAR